MVRGALKLFYNDHFQVPLPPNHRFPMSKYALVRKALQRELTPRGLASFHPSPLATLNELTACHTAEYVDRYVNNKLSEKENRRVGFPWSQASVNRSLSSTGGTVAAMRAYSGHPESSTLREQVCAWPYRVCRGVQWSQRAW